MLHRGSLLYLENILVNFQPHRIIPNAKFLTKMHHVIVTTEFYRNEFLPDLCLISSVVASYKVWYFLQKNILFLPFGVF